MNAQYDVVVKGDGCTGGVAKQQILLVMSFRPRPTGNLEIGEPTAARSPLLSSAVAGWISQGRCRSGRIRERGCVGGDGVCVRLAGWLAFILAAPPTGPRRPPPLLPPSPCAVLRSFAPLDQKRKSVTPH